jgi:hypothetical protein
MLISSSIAFESGRYQATWFSYCFGIGSVLCCLVLILLWNLVGIMLFISGVALESGRLPWNKVGSGIVLKSGRYHAVLFCITLKSGRYHAVGSVLLLNEVGIMIPCIWLCSESCRYYAVCFSYCFGIR